MIPVPVKVRSKSKYVIHLEFSDGTKGDVDISHLANKGVFKAWEKGDFFSKVYLNKISSAVAWSDEIELCPDSLFLKLKGLTFEEWKSKKQSHATN